jgi:nitrite reductase/ring-hydroxylating ferredoxin subunit
MKRRYQQQDTRLVFLEATKRRDNEKNSGKNQDVEESSRGKFRFLGGGGDKENPSQSNNKEKSDDDQPGFFRSVFKRYGTRKDAKEARMKEELEKELTAILNIEASDSRFFDISSFDASSITSALTAVESSLKTARDQLRSVRTVKDSPSVEEQRLEELRRRAAAERERRLAKRIGEANKKMSSIPQANIAEEAKPQEKGGISKMFGVAPKSDGDLEESEEKQRSNPLSVAQKFFSGVFEKQREEWIPVAPKTRISPGEIVPITSAGLDLLLVASKDGSSLHCIANSCPHLGTPLETGSLDRRPIETPSDQSVPEFTAELQETDIASLLAQDGCEDCIVCPLHKTAFALESGEVRGEWCPWPPILGKAVGTIKSKTSLPVFDVRTRGKNIEVRLNTPFKT